MDKYKLEDAYKRIGKLTVELDSCKETEEKFRTWWLQNEAKVKEMQEELEKYTDAKPQSLIDRVISQISQDLGEMGEGDESVCLLLQQLPEDVLEAYLPEMVIPAKQEEAAGADFDVDKPL